MCAWTAWVRISNIHIDLKSENLDQMFWEGSSSLVPPPTREVSKVQISAPHINGGGHIHMCAMSWEQGHHQGKRDFRTLDNLPRQRILWPSPHVLRI
jgi:hypothetical protein